MDEAKNQEQDPTQDKFKLFEEAAKHNLLVRIHYTQGTSGDPALASLGGGVQTIIDCYPLRLTDNEIIVTQAVASDVAKKDVDELRRATPERVIPRNAVLEIHQIGMTMASLPRDEDEGIRT